MRVIIVAGLAFAALAQAAFAQPQGDPVLDYYRAYRAAYEQGDTTAAAAAAEQALAASQARDGDGGSTVVLAYNLAAIRLITGDAEGARQPARLAYDLSRGGSPGLDPALAELVLARAELAATGRPGADWMRLILGRERTQSLPASELFRAGSELGSWAYDHRDYALARTAWDFAAAHSEGSPLGSDHGLAQARTRAAASIIIGAVRRGALARMSPNSIHDAQRLLAEAADVVRAAAASSAIEDRMTAMQQAYAETLAWDAMLRAQSGSDGLRFPRLPGSEPDGFVELGVAELQTPRCQFRLSMSPPPQYPEEQLSRAGVAGVVMRLRIDASGRIVEARAVARVGDADFSQALERVATRWTAIPRADSAPGCRIESILLAPVSFVAR